MSKNLFDLPEAEQRRIIKDAIDTSNWVQYQIAYHKEISKLIQQAKIEELNRLKPIKDLSYMKYHLDARIKQLEGRE